MCIALSSAKEIITTPPVLPENLYFFLFIRSSKNIDEFTKTILYYRLYMLSRRPLASNCCELPSRTNLDFAIGE